MLFKKWLNLNESKGIRLTPTDLQEIRFQVDKLWQDLRFYQKNNDKGDISRDDLGDYQPDFDSVDKYVGIGRLNDDEPYNPELYDWYNYEHQIPVFFRNKSNEKTSAEFVYDLNQPYIVINIPNIKTKQQLFAVIVHELIHHLDPKIQRKASNKTLTPKTYKDYMLSPTEFDAHTSHIVNLILDYAHRLKGTKSEPILRKHLQNTLLFLTNPSVQLPTMLNPKWTNEKTRTWDFYWNHADPTSKRKMQQRIYKATTDALDILNMQ